MFKAKVINKKTNQVFISIKESKKEIESWIDDQNKNNSFGNKKDISIEIVDISKEENEKVAASRIEKEERKQLKEMINDLDKYDKVQDWRDKVNKALKMLLKDMKD